MSSFGSIGDNDQRDPDSAYSASRDEVDEYYDRERWHDVEHESTDENENEDALEKQSRWMAISVAILLVVTIIAGGSGVVAAYLFHRHAVWLSEPIPRPANGRNTPARWIGYTPNTQFYCEVDKPLSFAATRKGEIYIGDETQNRLYCYSERGALLRTLTLPAVPLALAVGEEDDAFAGKIVVAHPDRMAVYSKDGEEELSWKLPGEDSRFVALVLGDRALFAADDGKGEIYRYNEEGRLELGFGKQFAPSRLPISMTYSRKANLLYVSNPGLLRIEAFTPEGDWLPALGWEGDSGDLVGFCGSENPLRLVCLDGGRLVTAEKEINRVKVYFPNGKLDCVVAGPEILDMKPPNIPQLESFTPAMLSGDKEIFIAAVHDDFIVVFDPQMRVARYFAPTHFVESKANAE